MMRKCGLVAVCALVLVVLDAGLASAHVTVSPSSLPQGTDDAILTFRVPNESDTAAVTGLKIQFPLTHPIVLLNPESGSGWQVSVVKAELPKPITTDDGTFTVDDERNRLVWRHHSGRAVRRVQRAGAGHPDGDPPARLQGDSDLQRRHGGVVDSSAGQGGARPRAPRTNHQLDSTAGTGSAASSTATTVTATATVSGSSSTNAWEIAALILAGFAVCSRCWRSGWAVLVSIKSDARRYRGAARARPLTRQQFEHDAHDAQPKGRVSVSGTTESDDAAPTTPGRPHHGEELGMGDVDSGDDAEKGGENIWISRNGIDPMFWVAQSVFSSETTVRRTSSDHRKMGAREARREAARPNRGKPRERCKAGSREGSEPRKGSVTGVGRRIRLEMVRDGHGGFPGAAESGPGGGCPTRPRHGASGPSKTWPRGAREASAERLLGVASRPGSCCGPRSIPHEWVTGVRGRHRRGCRDFSRYCREAQSLAGRSPAATWRFISAWTRDRSSGWVTPMQRP